MLRMTQPEEREVLRRLCNLAMKITAEREARQAKTNEANTDKDGKGDRVKDEKVHNVWTNVYMNGRSVNVKQAGYGVTGPLHVAAGYSPPPSHSTSVFLYHAASSHDPTCDRIHRASDRIHRASIPKSKI